MIFFIIFAFVTVGYSIFSFSKTRKLVTTEMIDVDIKKVIISILIDCGIIGVLFALTLVEGMIMGKYPCDGLHWFKLIAGGIAFGFSLICAIHLFVLHYYGKNIEEKTKKILMYSFIGLFIVAFLSLFLWADGFAPYLEYPIVNGIKFTDGLGFVTPKSGKPNLAWYAICIVSGAALVYFMCDHFMYKEYGKHGILESTFYIAFPAGIIGARLWYCIGEGVPFADWYKIWQGGLTILGGAIMGILVGVLWFLYRNKKYSIWVAVDCIVPTILIAQAVGRFGNFFNCEVHGLQVSVEYFKWLPEIVRNNMRYSSTHGFAAEGMMYVPLFFIEALINVFGYFFIAHFIGKKLRKVLEPGDLAVTYVIWYGLTRVILEPFRDPTFNMGSNGYWSWIWSLIFVFAGALAIIGNHIVRYILKKRAHNYVVLKNDNKLALVETCVFSVIGITLTIVAICLFSTNTFSGKIGYDGFNIGIMLLILGISVLIFDVPAIIRFMEYRKFENSNSSGEING